jgi:hypothetical protein
LSPYELIRADSPPFFVVQGVNDTLVEVNVARAFVAKYRSVAFAPVYYVELPFTQHAFDVTASPRTSATTRAAVAFAASVVTSRPTLTPELVANYQVPPTHLLVEVTEDKWLEAREAAALLGPFFIVTSDNPFSQVLTDEENQARRVSLRTFLERRGVEYLETSACDRQGRWPDELGVALRGLSREDVGALTRAWNQFAFYEVAEDAVIVRDAVSDVALA